MKDPELSLSVVVPTRNEAPNLEPLLEELGAALDGLPFEVIFVDDSNDETAALLERMAERHAGSPKVRAIHRALEKRTGLGSAVVEGVGLAVGDVIAVMDADLQHPPRVLRQMLLALEDSEVDLVIASRYVRGGSDRGLSGPMRRVISRSSKFLSQLLFKEARQTSDPLSGFFVCRRSAIEGITFRPIGFKILLEILVCLPEARLLDVPIVFDRRHAGESNASMAQGVAFLRHLWSLAVQVPGSARVWKYAAVGGSGLALYTVLLYGCSRLGIRPAVAWAIAFATSLIYNWQLNAFFTFADIASPFTAGRSRPLYLPVALLGGLLNFFVFSLALGPGGILQAGLGGALAAMILNYTVHRRLLRKPPAALPVSSEPARAITERIHQLLPGSWVQVIPTEHQPPPGPHGHEIPRELLRAAAEGKPVLVAEAPSHVPQARHDAGFSAWMAVPLVEGRRHVGLLVAHREGAPYPGESLQAVLRALRSDARDVLPRFSTLLRSEGQRQSSS